MNHHLNGLAYVLQYSQIKSTRGRIHGLSSYKPTIIQGPFCYKCRMIPAICNLEDCKIGIASTHGFCHILLPICISRVRRYFTVHCERFTTITTLHDSEKAMDRGSQSGCVICPTLSTDASNGYISTCH